MLCCLAPIAKRAPWDEIVEQVFPYTPAAGPGTKPSPLDGMAERILRGFNSDSARQHPAALHSSIFRRDSWETTKQNNLQQQFALVQQSPHCGPFIANALYIQTMQPRYKTHFIMVHVKLGLGLGQWLQLSDYQVLSLDEVMQLLHKRRSRITTATPSTTAAAFDRIEHELVDLENSTTIATTTTKHPETTLSRQNDDGDDNDTNPNTNASTSTTTTAATTTTTTTIQVPILFDVQVDDLVMMKSYSYVRTVVPSINRISSAATMMSKKKACRRKAREHFDELRKTVSFPAGDSPNLQ
jgi:hypothetical protein